MCYAGIVLCAMPSRVCIKATKQWNTTLHFMFYAIDGLVECQNWYYIHTLWGFLKDFSRDLDEFLKASVQVTEKACMA